MSSFFQYRRLRKEVQEDLAHAQYAQRSTSSSSSTTPPKPKQEEAKEDESKEEDSEKLTMVPGVTVSRPEESDGRVIFVVGWKENDPSDPMNWALSTKWMTMLTCCALTIPLTVLTSVEGPTLDAFGAHFHVNAEAASMTTGQTSLADEQKRAPTEDLQVSF